MSVDLLPIYQLSLDQVVDYLKRITDLSCTFELRDVPKHYAQDFKEVIAEAQLEDGAVKTKMNLFNVPGEQVKKGLVRSTYQDAVERITRSEARNASFVQPPGCGTTNFTYYLFNCCFQGLITPGGCFPSALGIWLVKKSFVALMPIDENSSPKVLAARPQSSTTLPSPRDFFLIHDLSQATALEEPSWDHVNIYCGSLDQVLKHGLESCDVYALSSWTSQEFKLAMFWCHNRVVRSKYSQLVKNARHHGMDFKALLTANTKLECPQVSPAKDLATFSHRNSHLWKCTLPEGYAGLLKDAQVSWLWKSMQCRDIGLGALGDLGDEEDLWNHVKTQQPAILRNVVELNTCLPSPPPSNEPVAGKGVENHHLTPIHEESPVANSCSPKPAATADQKEAEEEVLELSLTEPEERCEVVIESDDEYMSTEAVLSQDDSAVATTFNDLALLDAGFSFKKRRCQDAQVSLTCVSDVFGGNRPSSKAAMVSSLKRDIRSLKDQMNVAAQHWRMCDAALATMLNRLRQLQNNDDG